MPGKSIPTPNETMILRLLWREGPLTVRQIREELVPWKKLAYTSVLTVVNVLMRKGWLSRRRIGRADRYAVVVDEPQGRRLIVKILADRLFDGSLSAMGRFIESVEGNAPVMLVEPSKAAEAPMAEPTAPTFSHHIDVDLL